MKTIIIIIATLAILCMTSGALYSAPLFGDVPDEHWARDAVANLAAKGLVEGYPDGTFKGDRAATRYEMAMVIARFLAKNDQEHATFATKADLEELRKLVQEYLDEIEALGVRTTNLEEQFHRLDLRTEQLERIRFYGSYEAIYVNQAVSGDLRGVGTEDNPGVDWSNGRLLFNGQGFNSVAKVGIESKVNNDFDAGGEFSAYTSTGEGSVESYWGAVAPYLSNPFLGAGTVPDLTGVKPFDNIPWSRMTLDNFWAKHKPSETKMLFGSFNPNGMDRSILVGPKNPNIHAPEFLPLYGVDVSSYKKGRLLSWEAVQTSLLPQDSGGVFNYNTWLGGGNLAFNFDRGRISLNYLRTLNEISSFGQLQAAGIIPIPLGRSWLDARTNTLRTTVGPQAQNTYGIKADYNLSPEVKIEAEAAGTDYNPDTSKTNFDATSSGTLARACLSGNFKDRLRLALEYISVSSTYDPFLLRYQVPPNIPLILPYGTYYSNYWQLHDSNMYPSNRQGLKFNGSYRWQDTVLSVSCGSLEQVAPSTPAQIQSVGSIEPLFRTLQAGGNEKGRVNNLGIGLSHTFPCGLSANLGYFDYDIIRNGSAPVDDFNFNENVYSGGLSYPLARKLTLYANYTIFDIEGNTGPVRQSFKQDIPSIGARYDLGSSSYIGLYWHHYDLKDYANVNSNWSANQTMLEYKVNL